MRPRHCSPTGTAIGSPVSSTGMPRVRPSVDDMATQRTTLSPMCMATSRVRSMPLASSRSLSALSMLGRESDRNSTSTVGPITCLTWPIFLPAGFAAVGVFIGSFVLIR